MLRIAKKVCLLACTAFVITVVLMVVASTSVQAQTFTVASQRDMSVGSRYVLVNSPESHAICARSSWSPCSPGPRVRVLRVLVGPAHLPTSATRAVAQTRCPGQGLGAVCGTVAVPLDRQHPGMGQIQIFFELFTHINSGPAQSAILMNFGGPGPAMTDPADTFEALHLFSGNLDVHDLLLVDDRGRGLSGTINCIPLQHGLERFSEAEADCASQLGLAASRYGTGDIAQDIEDVRKALGYDKVDYFGDSYGGADVSAYATRFGSHLRSIVLDAPFGSFSADLFVVEHYSTLAQPRVVRLVCDYSPTCRSDHPNPVADLDWLIGYIHAHPIQGYAHDANGNLLLVKINEERLLAFIISAPTGNYVSTGELVAAARSLREGDPAPLLRLGAEGISTFPEGIDAGDPTVFSLGAAVATGCADPLLPPWNWSSPPVQRIMEYEHLVAALPPDYFSPFSRAAATSIQFGPLICLWWEKPTPSSPITPAHATYPSVPTLVLGGDVDGSLPLEEVSRVAELFPKSTFIPVAEAGHTTVFWSQCAANLASQFFETTRVGSIGCTRTPERVFPAVARFPVLAKDAIPAAVDPAGHNQIGVAERKAVTVAVAAAIDSLQRSSIGSGNGHCLRAGDFHTNYFPSSWTSTLTNCSFAKNVVVNGSVMWGANRAFMADLVLSGGGTAGGTIHVMGTWQSPGPVGTFKVSGNLGGLNVGLLLPEA